MLKNIIHIVFRKHHYWRSASFGEVAELYLSRTLTIFAINIASVLVPVYLYNIGYSLITIGCMYLTLFTLRLLLVRVTMKLIARFGPKHMIFWANILRIPPLIALLFVEQYGLPMLAIYVTFMAFGPSIYETSYNIDFSKVKHGEHAGKELGVMQMLEKFAKSLSPLVGGILATTVAPQATIGLAALLFVLSGIPLFKTPEPIKTNKSFSFKKPLRRIELTGGIARAAISFGWMTSLVAWSLFMTIFIFNDQNESIYAIIGALASFSVLVSMFSAWTFGRITDKHSGGSLLQSSVIATSLSHVARPFISTPIGVIALNSINETCVTGYTIAGTRAMFASADESGDRLFYFSIIEIGAALGAIIATAAFTLLILFTGDKMGITLFFFVAAAAELSILLLKRYAN